MDKPKIGRTEVYLHSCAVFGRDGTNVVRLLERHSLEPLQECDWPVGAKQVMVLVVVSTLYRGSENVTGYIEIRLASIDADQVLNRFGVKKLTDLLQKLRSLQIRAMTELSSDEMGIMITPYAKQFLNNGLLGTQVAEEIATVLLDGVNTTK